MSNNKKWLISFVTSFIFIKFISLVSADSPWGVSQGPQDLIYIIRDFFGPIFEAIIGVSQFDQYFFARILLLIVVYIVSSIALEGMDLFKKNKAATFIISAAVAILGARYIGQYDLIESILLPYGAVTIALTIILPFIVFFFFVHRSISSGLGRRAAWIFFATIFIGLWLTRRSDPMMSEFNWIYDVGIIAVLAAVAFDSKLHEYFGLIEASEYKRSIVKKQIADVEAELAKYANITAPSQTTKDVIKHLEQRRLDLARKL